MKLKLERPKEAIEKEKAKKEAKNGKGVLEYIASLFRIN